MKTFKIGLPCSPATMLTTAKAKATEIIVTYGGGMGGTNETYYAQYQRPGATDNEIVIRDISGREITLNRRYIVRTEPVTILEVVTDITAHTNYGQKVCSKDILHEFFAFRANEEVTISKTEFTGRYESKHANVILKFNETSK